MTRERIKPGRAVLRMEGKTSRPWADIQAHFENQARVREDFVPLANLARHLAHSAFVKQGLCGGTSHWDLIIGPSTDVFQNPHLRIEYDFKTETFEMVYVDGSPKLWERTASCADVNDVVDRFLTKRVRWYTAK